MIVYLARNTRNGKGYVGQTSRSLKRRWKEHVYSAGSGCATMPLFAAIRKYGSDSFDLTVLQECSTRSELDAAERYWIRELNTLREGYNATEGGHGISGYKHTEEAKVRMSQARRGERNPNWGGLSEEHKRNVSKGRQGKGTGPRPHARGWHHGEEARKKIGQAQYVKVVQLTMNDEVVATHDSMLAAAAAVGASSPTGISRACRYPHRSAFGFKWNYLREEKG